MADGDNRPMSSQMSQRDAGPLITVIMANYRGARFIEQALESILAQTVVDLEVIVSDDASPDDSVARVAELQRRDPRVRLLVAETNGGPARCRNRALAEARGKWIALVDSDDLIHPERFERLLAAADRLGVDIVADDLLHFHDDGTPSSLLLPDGQQTPVKVTTVDWILAGSNGLPPLGYLKPLMRASVLGGLRYDETLRIGEDYDFMLRLLLRGATLQVVPEPWYFYRRHNESFSHRSSVADLEAMIANHECYLTGAASLDPSAARALKRRLAKLNVALSFERTVAAIKQGNGLRALTNVLRRPATVARLARAALEHLAHRVPRERPVAPSLVVLSDEGSGHAELPDAVLIQVPTYSLPEQQTFGGAARRQTWRQVADLARGRPKVLVRGRAGAYAAGFIPDLGSSIARSC
jgi:succinoglycan biosynthesis protein ExoO